MWRTDMSEIRYISGYGSIVAGEGKPPAFADPPDLARRRRLLTAAFKRREALKNGRALRAGDVANKPPAPRGYITNYATGQMEEV